jgi:hypothetical protein
MDGGMSQPQGQAPSASTLSPDDVNSIVQALMQTPQMQWVAEQMDASTPQQPMQPQSQSFPQAQPQQSFGGQGDAGGSGGSGFPPQQGGYGRYSATNLEDGDMSTERYAQLESDFLEQRDRYAQLEAKFTEVIANSKALAEDHARLQEVVAKQSRVLIDKDRYSQIESLRSKYDVVDVEFESKKCLYSQGSVMTDTEFVDHIATVEKYAAAASARPHAGMIPAGVMPATNGKILPPEVQKDISAQTVERYSAALNAGKIRSYDEVHDEIMKEMGYVA